MCGTSLLSDVTLGATAEVGETCTRPDRGRGRACCNPGADAFAAGLDCSRSWRASENDPDAFIPPFTRGLAGASEVLDASVGTASSESDPESLRCSSAGDSTCGAWAKVPFAINGVCDGTAFPFRLGNESSPISGKSLRLLSASATTTRAAVGLML